MRRGDVVLVDLDPALAGEAAKLRPAVVVSNEGANLAVERLGRGTITVVPVTSNVSRVFDAFQVPIFGDDDLTAAGLRVPSKAQAEQVRSISAARVRRVVGRLPAPLLASVDAALRFHLSL
ncbi:type II toxin-antitoxin system PemK/MazF family toxin [Agromyces sp. ISL-38]|uniref:type II toxin-antitoxin system PemK/MazF family toxin n=1 Tax=Agromyces sp. ISL-38 TaxID=2819107 RepID=UPI001BEC1C82|nr:type II toxin-antitoxin system PemK/MazF family toxin [Agromyces sp. ISL-38]MBT2497918.1 type II toxin-antitoxin system PemK/MazF family toxin [Agromyces sp. ISL-38]